jgi:hypothetical protein
MPDSNQSPEAIQKRKEEIFRKIHASGMGGELDFQELEKKGILTREEVKFLAASLKEQMNWDEPSSDPNERIVQISMKVTIYQQSLPKDRAVPLDELVKEGALSAEDIEFMESHTVTYKPHRLADYHANDMFHMPTSDGGCVFIGPGGPELKKRKYAVEGFHKVMEDFLRLPNPDLLMHIEVAEGVSCGLSPNLFGLIFRPAVRQETLSRVREVAAELGLVPCDDREVQGSWIVGFKMPDNPSEAAAVAFALLTRGCGLSGEITYSAGALDVLEEDGSAGG